MIYEKLKRSLLLCSVATAATAASPNEIYAEGGMSSNGGDNLGILFEHGRKLATGVLRAIDERAAAVISDPEVREFILKNREGMALDLEKTKLVMHFDPQNTCAQTNLFPSADIRLSFGKCYHTRTANEAAELLIHEAVHHFGISNEDFANKVAVGVFETWDNILYKKVPLCPDEQNIVASGIIGAWKVNVPLSERMHDPDDDLSIARLTFTEDHTVLEKLPGLGKCAFTGGQMEMKTRRGTVKFPYIVVTHHGNTMVVYFEPDSSRPSGWDTESFNIMLARSADSKMKDLMLVGGDFNTPGLHVFDRID